ncbi:hypothetical protein CCR94_17790 [Rhodoblastus sphagnicola]|uniref:PAS domain-containing protein n=1 Tax=Rhodoblastus sphagnicola TaxID=333368 RepID=A0A2S6N1B0_9HYPH|nr:PAS domain-containing protein [Rhodoblastus sphagnicola]PPQ28411.1 hypothetical protein CCR94_17790 [Rhodoblastus sphagnicola]
MWQQGTIEVFRYWNRLRGARRAPDRSDIDPAAFSHLLSDAMILEADEAETYPLRVSCLRLNILFNHEQRARSFIDLFAREDRQEIRAVLRAAVREFHPVVAGVAAAPEGSETSPFELLLLPLFNGRDANPRILGALAPIAARQWFGETGASCLRLSSVRFLDA